MFTAYFLISYRERDSPELADKKQTMKNDDKIKSSNKMLKMTRFDFENYLKTFSSCFWNPTKLS